MENKNTLGRQIKISSILVQRNFIKEQLEKLVQNPNKDGQHVYRYVGHIFPENVTWLRDENLRIFTKEVNDGLFTTEINLITPFDIIQLTAEEMELAAAFVQPKKTTEEKAREAASQSSELMKSIFPEGIKGFIDSLGKSAEDGKAPKTPADKVDTSVSREVLDEYDKKLKKFLKGVRELFDLDDDDCPKTPTGDAGGCDWCKADMADEAKDDASDPVPPPYSV